MGIIITIFGLYVAIKLTDHFLASKGYKGKESDHFNGTVFYSYGIENPEKSGKPAMSKRAILKWMMSRKTHPGPTDGNWSTSPTRMSAALGGKARTVW